MGFKCIYSSTLLGKIKGIEAGIGSNIQHTIVFQGFNGLKGSFDQFPLIISRLGIA